MKLKKELVDELIREAKEYFTRSSSRDNLPAFSKAEINLKRNGGANWVVVSLISDLTKFSQRSGIGTYEDIYKALAIFGVIVE